MAVATTLANISNVSAPLAIDAQGDLFAVAGASVLELPLGPNGYATTPTTLLTLNTAEGSPPLGSLILDSAGDIFARAATGGPGGGGTVFEIAKTANGYASQPVILDTNSPPGSEVDGLVADAAGDLFGIVNNFNSGNPTPSAVFEIAKTSSGYSSPMTIAADPASATFLSSIGIDATGTLYVIAAVIGSSFSNEVITVSGINLDVLKENSARGSSNIAIDKAGDVFFDRLTQNDNLGELVKQPSGYSDRLLVSYVEALTPGGRGSQVGAGDVYYGTPSGPNPIIDAAGDVFDAGYELPVTPSGFAGLPPDGSASTLPLPESSTVGFTADSRGDLFGANSGGIFELQNAGYVTGIGSGPDTLTLFVSEDAYLGNAQFTIDVNNQQVGGVMTATALQDQGQTQTIAVNGYFGATNTVTIDFLNDAYAGTPQTDRNLYVDGATVTYPGNVAPINNSTLSLYSQGTQSFTFTTPGYTPPAAVTVGSGPDDLALAVSEDAFDGDAQYTIAVDGQQVGGTLTANPLATHGTGEAQTVNVLGSFGPGIHTVSVDFLNDAFAGLGQDRNLYVEGSKIDGVAVPGGSLSLLSQGTQSFNFTVPGTPAPITVGSGPDTLSLQVSEDAYLGNAAFTIDVNNEQVDGVLTTNASHAAGQTQTINVEGYFGTSNTVTVDFLNDAYAGTPTTDRNLYIDGATVTYPGATAPITSQTIAGSTLSLYSQGAQSFTFATPGYTPPAAVTVGSGPDDLALAVSEDAFNGDAQYTVAVDGQQVGGTLTANPLATHGTGEAQTVNVLGSFGAGTHTVAVSFLNDAFAGLGQDRNLYVEGSSINGAAVPGGSLTLLSQGAQSFSFTVPAH